MRPPTDTEVDSRSICRKNRRLLLKSMEKAYRREIVFFAEYLYVEKFLDGPAMFWIAHTSVGTSMGNLSCRNIP